MKYQELQSSWSQAGKWLKGLFKKVPCPPRQVDLNLDEHAARSLMKRGWTEGQIQEAVEKGKAYPAVDKTAGRAPATRYIHPTTGKSVVVNNETGKVIHLEPILKVRASCRIATSDRLGVDLAIHAEHF